MLSIDLEYETDVEVTAPEPALYETAYVTSHKGNCRAGTFSADGQLVATGSVDASIKVAVYTVFSIPIGKKKLFHNIVNSHNTINSKNGKLQFYNMTFHLTYYHITVII